MTSARTRDRRVPGGPAPQRRKPALAIALVGAAGLVAAIVVWRFRGPDAPAGPVNVLLITIDTLRADALGSYGGRPAATPLMDRLAERGLRFTDAHAHNVVTLPSHANILSGRYPFDHGIRDNSGFRFPAPLPTLATVLQSHGYRSGAFVSAFPLDSRFGLDRGFDVYDDRFNDPESKVSFEMQERFGRDTVAAAAEWLRGQQGPGAPPVFLWVHLYDPHAPYRAPAEIAGRFPDAPYAGEVAAADAALAPLLEPLLGAGAGGRTLVVLTADHGESLGEHGEMTHGIFTYEATLRVPLIVYAPWIARPAVVEEPVRHVDLFPTILAAAGLPAPDGLPGRSLLGLARGERDAPVPAYFESLSPALNRGWAPARGVRDGALKYIDLPLPELYDVRADPAEVLNLAATRPDDIARLRRVLADHRARDPGAARQDESAEVRERLSALGYVSGATLDSREDASYSVDDDPKRLIALDTALQEAIELYRAGDLAAARARCAEVVARRPDMPLARQHLAFLAFESGDVDEAVAEGRRVLALEPSNAEAAAMLGNYLNEAGRSAEAVAMLDPYARRPQPDIDVLVALATAHAQEGRSTRALAILEQARAIDPTAAMVLLNIGTVHLMTGDHARARESLRAALERQPDLARAYNSLGVIEAESGDPAQAILLWQQSVALNPRAPDTLFNLATLLRRQGRAAEARPYLEQFLRWASPNRDRRDLERAKAWLRESA